MVFEIWSACMRMWNFVTISPKRINVELLSTYIVLSCVQISFPGFRKSGRKGDMKNRK